MNENEILEELLKGYSTVPSHTDAPDEPDAADEPDEPDKLLLGVDDDIAPEMPQTMEMHIRLTPMEAPTQMIFLEEQTPPEAPFEGQMTLADFAPEEPESPAQDDEDDSWKEQLMQTRKEKIRDFQIKQNRDMIDFRYAGEEEEPLPPLPTEQPEADDVPDTASQVQQFTGDYTAPEQAEDIRLELSHRYRLGRFRLWLAAAAQLLLLWSTCTVVYYGQPNIASSLFVTFNLLLLTAMAALLFPMLRDGAIALANGKPNAETVPAVTTAAVWLHTLLQFFRLTAVESGDTILLTSAGGLLLLLCGAGRLAKISRIRQNFELVSEAGEKTAVALVQDEHAAVEIGQRAVAAGVPRIAYFRPAAFLDDFLANSYMDDAYDTLLRRYLPIGGGLAAVIGLIAGLTAKSGWDGITAFAAALCLILPAATLALNLPLLRVCRRLLKGHNLLCGFAAAQRFGQLDGAAMDVSDLYLQNSVALHGIRTFGDARIDEVIMDAASVAVRADGPLSGLFMRIIEDNTQILQPVENLVFEQDMGFSGWVGGRRVLVGNRKLLENHGVYTPSGDYERKYKKNGRELVYLSVAGELSAMFIISYVTDPEVEQALHRLQSAHISLLIRSCDPNVTEESLCAGFELDDFYVDLMPAAAGRLYDSLRHEDADRVSAGAAVNGSTEGIADLLIGCRRLRTGGILAMVLQLIGGGIGAIFCFAAAAFGGVPSALLMLGLIAAAAGISALPALFC